MQGPLLPGSKAPPGPLEPLKFTAALVPRTGFFRFLFPDLRICNGQPDRLSYFGKCWISGASGSPKAPTPAPPPPIFLARCARHPPPFSGKCSRAQEQNSPDFPENAHGPRNRIFRIFRQMLSGPGTKNIFFSQKKIYIFSEKNIYFFLRKKYIYIFSQKKNIFFLRKNIHIFFSETNIYIFSSPSIKGLCVGDRQNCVLPVDRDFAMRARAFN